MNRTIRRTMCILLALVLMSSSAVSYTYAEYARVADAADTGRTTHWGVTTVATGDAFTTKYVSASGDNIAGVAVKSSTLNDVVAPGTAGAFTGIRCTGTPEVAVIIEITPDLQLTNWVANGRYYCPLKITINGHTYYGMDYASSSAFENAVENAIKEADGFYPPGTDLSTITDLNGEYAWTWDFGLDGEGNIDEEISAKDTALQGKASASLSVKCYIYQAGENKDDGLTEGGDLDIGDFGEIEWF